MTDTKQLSADEILACEDLEIIRVEVPEWGGAVFIRAPSLSEGIQIAEQIEALPKEAGRKEAEVYLTLAAHLVNEKGDLLFATPAACQAVLAKKSDRAITRIAKAIKALTDKVDPVAAKKDSGEVAPDSSPTALPFASGT